MTESLRDDPTGSLHAAMPFSGELGLEVVSVGTSRVEAKSTWTAARTTAGGAIHGGFLMGAADSVGALCAFLNLPEGATTSTIESKTNFLRPVTGGEIRFVATPVHAGRRIVVVQTDALDEDGRLVSRTIQTQAILE